MSIGIEHVHTVEDAGGDFLCSRPGVEARVNLK